MGNILEESDIVMCTVDRIVGTTIFVKIPLNGKEIEGSIIMSEIAPGRIRNLRDYVVPKKKIICKILRISGDRIELSLRRVTQKEQKEVKEQYEQEKSYKSILKTILGKDADKIIKEISEKEDIYELFKNINENEKKIEKILGIEKTKKIIEILKNQKQKKAIIKKEIFLTTEKPKGVELIKEILGNIPNAEIKYLCAGKYKIGRASCRERV